jgi:hypothetical protein
MWREPLTGNTGENSESHKPIICGKSPRLRLLLLREPLGRPSRAAGKVTPSPAPLNR